MARRTGRRPGNPDTRQSILAAAREVFGERGYDSASIRAIATNAGVDPALVHHYFGTKEQLFLATLEVPLRPADLLPQVLTGGRDEIGERLVRTFLGVWDSPAGTAGAALFRTAVNHEWTARLLREFVLTQVLRPAMQHFDLDQTDGPLRVSLVASQLAGLVMTRYILKVEPIASAPKEVVIAAVGPTLQRYITGPIS